jgi:hypothetical protein
MASWNGWAWLGGPVIGGRPVTGRNVDGRLEVFGHAAGGAGQEIVHAWQTAPGAGWGTWDALGAPPTGNVGDRALGGNGDGRLEVFIREGLMTSGVAWHAWQQMPPATGWNAWDTLGSPPGGLANVTAEVGRNGDGRLEVFAFASDGAVWHIWQQAAGGWSGWHGLDAPSGLFPFSLAVGETADGRLVVFVVVLGGGLWRRAQAAAGSGWGAWEDLGMPPAIPLAGSRSDGMRTVAWRSSPSAATSRSGTAGRRRRAAPGAAGRASAPRSLPCCSTARPSARMRTAAWSCSRSVATAPAAKRGTSGRTARRRLPGALGRAWVATRVG